MAFKPKVEEVEDEGAMEIEEADEGTITEIQVN